MTNARLDNILIAYTATSAGRDALNLAITIAQKTDATLRLVTVVPEDDAFAAVYPSDRGHIPIIRDQVRKDLEKARQTIPQGIKSSIHTIHDTSDSAGLLRAAEELDASALVVGTRRGGIFGRFSLGSTANSILHSSQIPVLLAPGGYENTKSLDRVTSMFGTRTGSEQVIRFSLQVAKNYDLTLRLVSLLLLEDENAGIDPESAVATDHKAQIEAYGNEQLADQAFELVEKDQAKTIVASGKNLRDAIAQQEWSDRELVVFGSSRLAPPNRTFIGGKVTRILRHLPAPIMVIPADYS